MYRNPHAPCSLARTGGYGTVRPVREVLVLALHLLVALAKLLNPGGVREIEEVKSVPYAPVSHPFVERLIGTIRREYLDRVFFWNAVDLARKLQAFRHYCNDYPVHRAIAGLTPAPRHAEPEDAEHTARAFDARYAAVAGRGL